MEQDYRYEELILKHATYLATELINKINHFESEETNLIPGENVLLSKDDIDDKDSFEYQHGQRNMLKELKVALAYANPQGPLEQAVNELSSTTSNLAQHLVPLNPICLMEGEEEEEKEKTYYVELFLVKEKCLVQLTRLDDSHLFKIRDNPFKELIKNVLRMVSCFQTMNRALMEKEKAMRAESYFKLMKEALEKDRMERLKYFKDDSDSSPSDGEEEPKENWDLGEAKPDIGMNLKLGDNEPEIQN